MARLVVESGMDEGMVYPLVESVTTLGRGPSNTVQIADRRASRFHAEIVRRGAVYKLRDLRSKNGTRVQDVRVTGEVVLRHGDQIRIGQTVYVFEDEDAQDAVGHARGAGATSAIRLADTTPTQMCGAVRAGSGTALREPLATERGAVSTESQRRLRILLQVLEKVRSLLDVDEVLREILDLVFEVFRPERGVILMYDSRSNSLVPRVVKGADGGAITISRTIVQQAIVERASLLISDAAADRRFRASESIILQHIRSAMCAPLFARETFLGVLYIDSLSHRANYTQDELQLLTGITDQAALAVSNALLHQSLVEQNRLERELEIARTIQMNLLPRRPPVVSGFEIAAMSLPAKCVGGDYYDFVEIDPDHLAIVVADVSGKGVPAAILTASVRAALQVELRHAEAGLPVVVANVNDMACRDMTGDMFISVFLGLLQISSRRLRYINAGHCPPILWDTSGREVLLDKGGCVLGVMPGRTFEQAEVRLVPHSTLLIYTDGVTDVFNESREAFGLARLRHELAEGTDMTAAALRDAILDATNAHQGAAEQYDDYTLVVVKAL
ncbi:MAG: SpoIIE family protein phosphatase [Candidatus Sumerlaeia bacterium]|nr:SpoIIE family protein phosphatase [Candidatus Sumerlaeia bacterium]